jgi:uncharacterized protein
MLIKLSEIPDEGRSYAWNSKTGEVNKVLSDLIQKNSYEVDFTIRPINSKDFELVGRIVAQAPEVCSRCGVDILFPVQVSFREILIPPQPTERLGHYARVNHVSEIHDDGPSSTEYGHNQIFDIGEYLHEAVALNIPTTPIPSSEAEGRCAECREIFKDKPFVYDEGFGEPLLSEVKPNPFDVLKNLKLQ